MATGYQAPGEQQIEHKCSGCEQVLIKRTSQTAANPGREFWACPGRCKGWRGWCDAPPINSGDSSKKRRRSDQGVASSSNNTEIMAAIALIDAKIDALQNLVMQIAQCMVPPE